MTFRSDAHPDFDAGSLVGSYFRSADWSGRVVAEPSPACYLVQVVPDEGTTYGRPFQRLVDLHEMMDGYWQFFDTPEWRDAVKADDDARSKAGYDALLGRTNP